MHVGHNCLGISLHLGTGHGEQGIHAVNESGGGTQGNQGIHVGRPVGQALKAIDEKFLVHHHDSHGEQKLYQTHGDVVAVKEVRQRPAPHHMSHGKIHERDQQAEGNDEPLF